MKHLKNILALSLFTATLLTLSPVAMAQSFAIVVNSANAGSADTSLIKNLYLKKQTSWGGGAEAVPLARSAGSPEQEAFLSSVLGMSQSDLDNYWASEKSKTGATGPREVGSTNILLRQIGRKPGAFGVVSAAEASALPEGVKVLSKF